MILNLKRVLGYEGSKPITGSAVATFKGNEKKCTKDAKQWLKDNPQPITPVFEWKKEER